ncbi:MAG: glycosyltransferase [Phycisphaerales bacterium]|nr:MAG: glycosyltransferase [Phycisphaerales bacterium]
MTRSQTIIVVPCYNEADRLDVEAFRRFDPAGRSVRFLLVNDGSTDETRVLLERLREADGELFSVLTLDRNRGKAEAVRQGMLEALKDEVAYVGFWDADLATPLEDIALFCRILDERSDLEMVFGSRVNLLGRKVRRNLLRHYIGRIFATAASAVLQLPIYDTQCGAKLFRATDEMRRICAEPFISRWIFDVELIARYVQSRRGTDEPPARDIIYELPLMRWIDVKGSKVKARHFIAVAFDLLRIQLKYFTGA